MMPFAFNMREWIGDALRWVPARAFRRKQILVTAIGSCPLRMSGSFKSWTGEMK